MFGMAERQGPRAKGKKDAVMYLPEVAIPSLGSQPLALCFPLRQLCHATRSSGFSGVPRFWSHRQSRASYGSREDTRIEFIKGCVTHLSSSNFQFAFGNSQFAMLLPATCQSLSPNRSSSYNYFPKNVPQNVESRSRRSFNGWSVSKVAQQTRATVVANRIETMNWGE